MSFSLVPLVTSWQLVKRQAKEYTAREKDVNKEIQKQIEQYGYQDDKGHQWYDLEMEVEGYDSKGKPIKFGRIQRQRRVSLDIDDEVASEILERRGILSECEKHWVQVNDSEAAIQALAKAGLLDGAGFEVISELDQEAIRLALFEGKITPEEWDEMVKEKVSWALLTA